MDVRVVIGQMVQLFIMMAVGYVLMKIHLLDEEFNKKLNKLVLSLITPCLILSSVLNSSGQSKSIVIYIFLIAVVVYVLLPIISYILVIVLKIEKPKRGLFMFMTIFSNTGFMGFPIMKSIFGDTAVFYTAIFNMVFNIEVFTLGIMLMNYGQEKIQLEWKNLLSPGIVSSLMAIIIYFLEIPVPSVVMNVCSSIGDMTTPLAMLLIGASLSKISFKDIFGDLKLYPFTFVKQILLPFIAFPVICYFISDPFIQGVTLLNLAMPVGNMAVLFATQYNRDTQMAAKTVFMTTLFSVVSIPFIVSVLL